MYETIELTIDSPDGPVDCQVERTEDDGVVSWSVVILYPHTENGIMRSKVYDHQLIHHSDGSYTFPADAAIHPKIKQLERALSAAIINNSRS